MSDPGEGDYILFAGMGISVMFAFGYMMWWCDEIDDNRGCGSPDDSVVAV